MLIFYLLIFIFGLFIGSFLNCVIYRLEQGESFLKGRSYCPNCKHQLAWYDLLPVLSFLFLRGRCRYCKKPISWQYPIVELFTGIVFILPFFSYSFFKGGVLGADTSSLINYIYYLLIFCFLIIIFVYDLKHYIILDKVLLPTIVISFLYLIINSQLSIINHQPSIINYILSALGASALFLFIYLISKGKWLGFGDVKLVILLGLFLGWPKILLAIFLSFIIGGIIGTGLVLFSKKKLKSEVPFAPFLIIGTLIAFLWGGPIIGWYSNLVF